MGWTWRLTGPACGTQASFCSLQILSEHVAGSALVIQSQCHRRCGLCRTDYDLTTLVVLPVVLEPAQHISIPRLAWGLKRRSRYDVIMPWYDSQGETRHGEANGSRHVLALATSAVLWSLGLSSLPYGFVFVRLFHCLQGVLSLPS